MISIPGLLPALHMMMVDKQIQPRLPSIGDMSGHQGIDKQVNQ